MSPSKKSNIPQDKLELYDRLVAAIPEVARKGATVPYTSFNGNMFTYLDSTGSMALQLPKGVRETFIERYDTKLFDAYGVVQQEYVKVPDALLADIDELRSYFAESYEYAKTLKPKPTKREQA